MNTYTIEGKVLNSQGIPVYDAMVTIVNGPGNTPDIAAITNQSGAFTFYGLVAGNYRLKAVLDQRSGLATINVSRDSLYLEIMLR